MAKICRNYNKWVEEKIEQPGLSGTQSQPGP